LIRTAGTAVGPDSTGEPPAGPWRALVMGAVGCAFLLRLSYAGWVELLPEETYYWNYSRHLDIGYLDHPPMVAWLIRLGTGVFGDTAFGVRFGALVCGVTASLFLFRLTRNLFGAPSAQYALLLSLLLPFFFMSGLLMTPDAPLTACWAAALYCLERALIAGRPRAWWGAGVALGVGLLSKYTIVLLGGGALLFMLLDPVARRDFRRPEPYAAVLIAAAVFAPVIYWNAQHEWASFAFQTSRRLAERPRFSLHKLIGAAVVLITPTGVAALVAALLRRLPADGARTTDGAPAADQSLGRRRRFLAICMLVPLAVFFVFSLRHEVKLDWTGAPWVAALPLLGLGMAQAAAASRGRWPGLAWPPTLALLLLIYAVGLWYLAIGIPGVGYSSHMELAPVGWREFGRRIEAVADSVRRGSGDVLVVGMDRYAIASEAAFYAADRSRSVATSSSAHLFGDMGLMYERWFPPAAQAGRTLLLVAWDAATLQDPRVARQVERLDPVQVGELTRNQHLVRRFYYRVAHGYRPEPQNGR
jgi:dolichol-phosphate mannosyltransferase